MSDDEHTTPRSSGMRRRLEQLLRSPTMRRQLERLLRWSRWRRPERYAHNLESDDFWILAGRWNTHCPKIAPRRIHPLLGWSQGPVSDDNPLGLVPDTTRRLVRDGRPKILCFGDSYIDGPVDAEDKLPSQLDRRLAQIDVLNLGVGGYGTGQMHLLCREVLPLVGPPALVLFGIEQFSFDRAGLGVRSYQKPRLVVREDGGLDVANLPIDPDPERFFRKARLSFSSYRSAARRLRAEPPVSRDFGFEDKVEVNRAIMAANQRLVRDAGHHLAYIVFQDYFQLAKPDRRTAFFTEELKALGVPVLDLGPVVRAHAAAQGTDGSELYAAGHLNAEGNRIAADAIFDELVRMGFA